MEADDFKAIVKIAQEIQASASGIGRPPSEVVAPTDEPILPHSLFKGTRGYIEKIVYQINSTYATTSYDACAVMVRRLVEVLIIEAFSSKGMADKITDANGDFYYLNDLIDAAIAEPSWKLNRNTKKGLPRLKSVGDQSAHGRNYNARRAYIDDVIDLLRTVSEDLLYQSGLRK